jgi:hypothetical protein
MCAGFLLSCVFSHQDIHCFTWNMFHCPISCVQCAFRHWSLQILCCISGRVWLLHCLLLWKLWIHSYLFIMSDSLCLSYPMVALNLMEAVLCSPIKVLRFCSELDYGCGAWNFWSRLVSSGSAYFYFERLSFPRHLSWNRQLSVFP